jgi:SAM-dependent methyltransferase
MPPPSKRNESDTAAGTDAAVDAKRPRNNADGTKGVTGFRDYTVSHGANLMTDDSVYGDLKLMEASQKVKGVRVRQHVNPLSSKFQAQAPTPDWNSAYADATKPLTIDIGCAGGRFDLLLAKRNPGRNVLGVDVREPLVERGLKWGEASGVVDNIHFATCNATVSIGEWIKSYNENGGNVELVTILHPDPHCTFRSVARRAFSISLHRLTFRAFSFFASSQLRSVITNAESFRRVW